MRRQILELLSRARPLLSCQRGSVAMIFAGSAITLTIAIGTGIDLWRAYTVKARLQAALDAGGLAVGSSTNNNLTTTELQNRLQS